MYMYRASLDRIIGPVTVAVRVDLGFRLDLVVPIRLDGLALPEDRRATQAITQQWLDEHPRFVCQTIQGRRQTFDRWFGILMDEDGSTLNDALLASGMVERIKSGEAPLED